MGIDLTNVQLSDVATWERSKKNKTYEVGSILLQVSATKGQLKFLEKDSAVGSKYAVITCNREQIEPYYLFTVLEDVLPAFLAKEQTGLNIQPDILKRLDLRIHKDKHLQNFIAEQSKQMDEQAKQVEKQISQLKEMKRWALFNMFPKEEQNVPGIRFKDFC